MRKKSIISKLTSMKRYKLCGNLWEVLPVLFVMIVIWGCGSSQKKHEDDGGDAAEELTLDEASQLVTARNNGESGTTVEEMFHPYQEVNEFLFDEEAPHNQGVEPLVEFVKRFSEDLVFQKERTHLREHSQYAMDYSVGLLEVLPPDSTNFFASWSVIQNDEASFCNGWLGSEMNKELIFCRSKDGHWYLVEYFSATKEW